MYFVIYKDTAGFWRWTLKASNHEPIAVSSESYVRKADAEYGNQLTKAASDARSMTALPPDKKLWRGR